MAPSTRGVLNAARFAVGARNPLRSRSPELDLVLVPADGLHSGGSNSRADHRPYLHLLDAGPGQWLGERGEAATRPGAATRDTVTRTRAMTAPVYVCVHSGRITCRPRWLFVRIKFHEGKGVWLLTVIDEYARKCLASRAACRHVLPSAAISSRCPSARRVAPLTAGRCIGDLMARWSR